MHSKMLLEYASIAEVILLLAMLGLMWRKKLLSHFAWLAAFVSVQAADMMISVPLLFFRRELGIPRHYSYCIYFYSHWTNYIVQVLLSVMIIQAIYRLAMKPLAGLDHMGSVIFKWVTVVSAVVTLSFAIVPQAGGDSFVRSFAERGQQGVNVLTICLLLFVCFAIRPLGLTYRSRIFGVSLGLGIIATVSLVEAAWFTSSSAQNVYSPVYAVGAAGYIAALLVWGFYFAMPEPERKLVLLPTTSPFFYWNRVSEALQDEPGFVAISGFRPEMLAPAELKVLTESARIARDNQRRVALEQELAALEASHPHTGGGLQLPSMAMNQ